MSTWLAVVLALASSAVGGFLGSWLTARMRINFEREEALRARMVDAADEFSKLTIRALTRLRETAHLVEPEDLDIDPDDLDEVVSASENFDDLRKAARETARVLEDSHTVYPRIILLFGPDSPSAQAALSVIANIRHGVTVVLDEMIPEVGLARRQFDDAAASHDRFNREARLALQRPSFVDPPTPTATRRETDRDKLSAIGDDVRS